MRTSEEIKSDLTTVFREEGTQNEQEEAAKNLAFDAVDWLLDVRDSLRAARLREIV